MAVNLSTNIIQHKADLLNYLHSSYEKEEHLDLAFVCKGGKVIKAHQLVLASVSPFLRELFNESITPEVSISVSEIDDGLLSQLLALVYGGTLKLLASEAREFRELIVMLGIEFPDDLYINVSLSSLNGIDEVQSSSAMAILSMENAAEFMGRSSVDGSSGDPLNIPDRYFAKPKEGSGQPNVTPMQSKPAGRSASTSEKTGNRSLRKVSTSPSTTLSTEGRILQTGTSVPGTETSARNEANSHLDTSNGPVHNEAKRPASNSAGRTGSGGLKKRKRGAKNAGDNLARKKTRSKDNKSNLT